MLKLIRGEMYRLLHKRSMYIYFGALVVGYFLLAYIRSGGFNEESIIKDAFNFFNFLPALAGGFLFSAIYTDDLGSRNLITLVGYGIAKTKIVIVKLIVTTLFGAAVFGLSPLVLYCVHAALGWAATANTMAMVYAVSLKYLLMTLAFAALSGIVVYGLQRTTFAMVSYILLAFNVVSGLITVLVSNMLGDVATVVLNRLVSGITDRILAGIMIGSSLIGPVIEYIIYVAIAATLSVLAFRKKEMEF